MVGQKLAYTTAVAWVVGLDATLEETENGALTGECAQQRRLGVLLGRAHGWDDQVLNRGHQTSKPKTLFKPSSSRSLPMPTQCHFLGTHSPSLDHSKKSFLACPRAPLACRQGPYCLWNSRQARSQSPSYDLHLGAPSGTRLWQGAARLAASSCLHHEASATHQLSHTPRQER